MQRLFFNLAKSRRRKVFFFDESIFKACYFDCKAKFGAEVVKKVLSCKDAEMLSFF